MNTKTFLTGSAIIMGMALFGIPFSSSMNAQGYIFNSFFQSLQPSTSPSSTSSCPPAPPSSTSYSCSSTQTNSGGTQSSTQTCYVSGKLIVGSCNNTSYQTQTSSGIAPTSQSLTSGVAPTSQ